MKGTITVTEPYKAKRNKAVALENNAPFINCISKINGIKIECEFDDYSISPKIRQILLHWGYELTEDFFNELTN